MCSVLTTDNFVLYKNELGGERKIGSARGGEEQGDSLCPSLGHLAVLGRPLSGWPLGEQVVPPGK
jgi:hypothetical protein